MIPQLLHHLGIPDRFSDGADHRDVLGLSSSQEPGPTLFTWKQNSKTAQGINVLSLDVMNACPCCLVLLLGVLPRSSVLDNTNESHPHPEGLTTQEADILQTGFTAENK